MVDFAQLCVHLAPHYSPATWRVSEPQSEAPRRVLVLGPPSLRINMSISFEFCVDFCALPKLTRSASFNHLISHITLFRNYPHALPSRRYLHARTPHPPYMPARHRLARLTGGGGIVPDRQITSRNFISPPEKRPHQPVHEAGRVRDFRSEEVEKTPRLRCATRYLLRDNVNYDPY